MNVLWDSVTGMSIFKYSNLDFNKLYNIISNVNEIRVYPDHIKMIMFSTTFTISFVVNYLCFVLRDSKKVVFRIGLNLRMKMKTVLYTISND